MLLFVGSGGTYDTSKEDEVKKVRRSHLVQSVFILHLRNERATEAIWVCKHFWDCYREEEKTLANSWQASPQ